MKLLTKEIIENLPKLYATDKIPAEQKKIVVKFFNPCGAGTWYIVEGEQMSAMDYDQLPDGSNDWMFFGWCDLGMGPGCSELGYVMLSDLLSVKLPFGLGIERDMHFVNKTLSDVME